MTPREQLARQEAIRRSDRATRTPSLRAEVRGGGGGFITVVLRSLDLTPPADPDHPELNPRPPEMKFQRIRYADSPPVVGQYEAFGEEELCYPLATAEFKDYESFVWPEASDPISTLTVPMMAFKDRGAWIVMIAPKFDASLLDPDAPVNGCSFG